jgi:ATP-binding cassette subfamily B protein
VGANGAGKTTFVRLLCRFYDPTQGRILVDGKDLREWDLESWYARLGVLFQDFSRYPFDVATAVAMGRDPDRPDMARVRGVAEAADAHGFIQKFPEGYRQQLSREFTGGVEPSGGQWQKLAIARALYREAGILVLDEPTSAVDAESEMKIFEALERLPDTQTAILISHRFSTVRHADQIVVIENQGIAERGTHEELLALNGTYARLFSAQAEGYR